MLKSKQLIFLCAAVAGMLQVMLCGRAGAQKLTSSPYSRYGIGEIYRPAFSQQLPMAGVSYAVIDSSYINVQNPASYGWYSLTVFEAGVRSSSSLQSSADTSQWANNTAFSHLAFGIPITRWWGGSFGILPYSSVGYKISNTQSEEGVGEVQYSYEGSGGINKAYIGNAVKIKQRLTLGFNAAYLFGSIAKNRTLVFSAPSAFNSRIFDNINVSHFALDFGAQYQAKINDSWRAGIGAVYAYADEMTAHRTQAGYTFVSRATGDLSKDTLIASADTGAIRLPQTLGFGISLFNDDKWLIAADYTMKNWSDFLIFGLSESFTNMHQVAAGAQYIPEKNAVGKFFRTLNYRWGARYSTGYININNTAISEYGISFGCGVPLKRSRSTLNLGIEVGERGTTQNNLIREQFINVNFGVAINDKWFIKRKYE